VLLARFYFDDILMTFMHCRTQPAPVNERGHVRASVCVCVCSDIGNVSFKTRIIKNLNFKPVLNCRQAMDSSHSQEAPRLGSPARRERTPTTGCNRGRRRDEEEKVEGVPPSSMLLGHGVTALLKDLKPAQDAACTRRRRRYKGPSCARRKAPDMCEPPLLLLLPSSPSRLLPPAPTPPAPFHDLTFAPLSL